MLKRLAILGSILLSSSYAFAEPRRSGAPPVQDYGPMIIGTTTVVIVSTTPGLVYSTGTYNPSDKSNWGWGQFFPERIQLEFFNDTSTDVWVGYSPDVSTSSADNSTTGGTLGRRIPPGGAWSHSGSIKNYWVVCATTTRRAFVTTQEK